MKYREPSGYFNKGMKEAMKKDSSKKTVAKPSKAGTSKKK